MATKFYKNPDKHKIPFQLASDHKPVLQNPSVESVEKITNKLIELYKAPQEELGTSLSLLNFYKKKLELSLAFNDYKINRTLLMEPTTRIAMATYLEIAPQELNDRDLILSEIPFEVQKSIINFSQSNDFRILLLQGRVTKEEIENAINQKPLLP